MNRKAAFACFNLALAVALGALGAHFLKERLSPDSLLSFQTGIRYHIYHGLALLVFSIVFTNKSIRGPWFMMALGMLLFSGSIYGLSLRGLTSWADGFKWLGPITPLGGLLLIISWLWLGVKFASKQE